VRDTDPLADRVADTTPDAEGVPCDDADGDTLTVPDNGGKPENDTDTTLEEEIVAQDDRLSVKELHEDALSDAPGDNESVTDTDAYGDMLLVGETTRDSDSSDDSDRDGEIDRSDELDADATAPDVTLAVTNAEGDAYKDTLGARLVTPLSDTCGLGDTAIDRDTVGEHDATGSINGAPTAEPTPTAHAFVSNPPPEPTPSNTTAR